MKVVLAASVLMSLALGGCASPVASLDNLMDIHRERTDVPEGMDTYELVRTIRHRGRCHRAWNSIRTFFWLDPNVKTREIDDPIKFSLYQLEVVLDDRDEFDDWDRLLAMVKLSDLVRRSPSRAIQAECLRVLGVYCDEAGMTGIECPLREPIPEGEWAELESSVRALEKIADAEAEVADSMLDAESVAIEETARALLDIEAMDPARVQRIALAAQAVGQRAADRPCGDVLRALAVRHTARTVFLSALSGCRPTAEQVAAQAEATRLLLAIDPYSGSRLLGAMLLQWIHPAGQVAVLQQLVVSRPDPARLDPDFRRAVAGNLFEPDGARRYWSIMAVSTLLELPEDTDRRELQSRWSALGGLLLPEES